MKILNLNYIEQVLLMKVTNNYKRSDICDLRIRYFTIQLKLGILANRPNSEANVAHFRIVGT